MKLTVTLHCPPNKHFRPNSVLVAITAVNCYSVKWVNRLQNFFNAGKLAGIFVIVGMGGLALCTGRHDNLAPAALFEPAPGFAPKTGLALLGQYAVAFNAGLYRSELTYSACFSFLLDGETPFKQE